VWHVPTVPMDACMAMGRTVEDRYRVEVGCPAGFTSRLVPVV
jgi:hypothetical protein